MNTLIHRVGLVIACVGFLSACSSVSPGDYAGNRPKLVPEEFFNGQLEAQGVVKNRAGKVVRYFTASINAYWREGIGTLEEDFEFDNGEEQRRVWRLQPDAPGHYIATAGDVVGPGRLEVNGNALFLDYVLRVPWSDRTIDLRIDDRMYLVSDNLIINESVMTKFGLRVGSISLSIRRL